MKLYRINAVIRRHTYEVLHNANHITYMVYWPVVNIVVWGFFTLYLRHGDRMQPGVISCLLGAVILWGLFNAFQRDMAVGFLEELWSRNLVSLFASPLSVSEYVTGLIIVTSVKALIGLIVESVIALLFYHYNIFPSMPKLIPFILNLTLFALTMGIVVTGLVFRFTTKLQAMAWSFAGILMPLSCVSTVELAAWLPAPDGLDTADHSIIRRYAAGYRKWRVFGLAFPMGSWIERGLFHIRDHVLPLDVRVGAIARTVGENGIMPVGTFVRRRHSNQLKITWMA